jgi:hypothetical protein
MFFSHNVFAPVSNIADLDEKNKNCEKLPGFPSAVFFLCADAGRDMMPAESTTLFNDSGSEP